MTLKGCCNDDIPIITQRFLHLSHKQVKYNIVAAMNDTLGLPQWLKEWNSKVAVIMTLKGSWYDDTKKNDTQRLPQWWLKRMTLKGYCNDDTKKNDTLRLPQWWLKRMTLKGYCNDDT